MIVYVVDGVVVLEVGEVFGEEWDVGVDLGFEDVTVVLDTSGVVRSVREVLCEDGKREEDGGVYWG